MKQNKKQQGGFLSMLLGTLSASLSGNLLAGKGAITTKQGRATTRAGKDTIRAGIWFLMPPHRLTNFEIQKYYQNEPKF